MKSIRAQAQKPADKLQPFNILLGRIVLACGIGMVLLGFPAQIYANWKMHECRMDPVLATVVLVLYCVRIPYQVSAKAWYLLPADILGLIASSIIMWQYMTY
jgi:hypothetical protein